MAKMHTPAMEKIEKKNRKRKKPVNSTPAYEAWKRFRRNKTAIIGLVVVGILILIAIPIVLIIFVVRKIIRDKKAKKGTDKPSPKTDDPLAQIKKD